MTDDLESLMIEQLKAGQCSLERALLIASGLTDEGQIQEYEQKLDLMQQDFERYAQQKKQEFWHKLKKAVLRKAGGHEYETARILFDYLWEMKPDRYNSEFLLTKVIDNQLDEDKNKKVGNCLGLTSLYSVLGIRLGLNLLPLDNQMYGSSAHILNVLFIADNKRIAVENTRKSGFGIVLYETLICKYRMMDLISIVAGAYNSRGHAKWQLRDFEGSMRDFDTAIGIRPDYASAYDVRGMAKLGLGDFEGSMRDFDTAIELRPDYADAYNYGRNAKRKLEDFAGAERDFAKADELSLASSNLILIIK